MGVYIKGMKLPKDAERVIVIVDTKDGREACTFPKPKEDIINIREPHGRLIDADVLVGELESDIAFINEQLKEYRLKPHNFVDDFDKKIKVVKNKLLDEISIIEAAPTVIEGSEE